jgi:hypothetical protein
VQENVDAIDVTLSPGDLAIIDSVFPAGVASGARYNDWGMSLLDTKG